jgi:uncharacterized protein involved in exopolysaccharide biosynthesis
MRPFSTDTLAEHPGFGYAPFGASPTARANRRRLLVFLGVFALAATVGLAYTFVRPEEYRATARLQITPDPAKPFLVEVEVLTSQPVLEHVAARLTRMGWDRAAFGPDPIRGMKAAIQVSPVAGTNVVEIAAIGTRPPLLAALVNTLIEAYTERIDTVHRDGSGESIARIDADARRLEAEVGVKRREVERFRSQHSIASLEREEKEMLARVRDQGSSLAAARERVAAAEGKLRSLRASAEAGKLVVHERDNPALASLETRASQAREEMREVERTFTPDYMALDPKVKAMRARLAELEQEIATQRAFSEQAALSAAREEVSSARQAARRIEQQMAEAGQSTPRFREYRFMQEELAQLEGAYRDTVERKTALAAAERARTPSIQVLESATPPREVWRPWYARDAALSLGVALALALFAVWLVELFNRPEPQPSVLIAQPVVSGMVLQPPEPRVIAPPPSVPSLEAPEPALLRQHVTPARELGQAEVLALLEAASDPARLAAILLLSGATAEEALALERSDLNLARRLIRVPGESAREIELSETVAAMLPAGPARPGRKLLAVSASADPTIADLESALLSAAHDANVERAADVTPECLRHTYIAFLVRQGLRFAELPRIVGPLSPSALAEYSVLAPPGPRLGAEAVDRIFPALRLAG